MNAALIKDTLDIYKINQRKIWEQRYIYRVDSRLSGPSITELLVHICILCPFFIMIFVVMIKVKFSELILV